jgi:transcription termination factor Rho
MSEMVEGVLQLSGNRGGFLRSVERSFQPSVEDAYVSPEIIRNNGLVNGAAVKGIYQKNKNGCHLISISSVCDLPPEEFKARLRFDKLVAINPAERIPLGDSNNVTMRIVDLIAPIGKGTRGLIVAPPKAGKTTILEQIAHAVAPQARLVVLLIDERPEEVTHFRRQVPGEVLASSSDNSIDAHINLVELTMAHIRCELECKRNVVVLVDSLTRMSRAFNLSGGGSKRTLSGGLDSRALEFPRRFFGMARNVENGGSVTVIATVQVQTGSRMDDYIFEEFKGTGNSEIVLDRILAEARIFPAINVLASGTRKEELLYPPDEFQKLNALHRQLAGLQSKDAMRVLLKLIRETANNNELLTLYGTSAGKPGSRQMVDTILHP